MKRFLMACALLLAAQPALSQTQPHPAYADAVLSCREMQADPRGVFGGGSPDLGSGHGSPLDVEYECQGGLGSLPFLEQLLALAEEIRGDQAGACGGSIRYAQHRYYLFSLLEAGLAPEKLARQGAVPDATQWRAYFDYWGYQSPSNYRLYRAFLAEEQVAGTALAAHFLRQGLAAPEAQRAAARSIAVIRNRAAGAFPGSGDSDSVEITFLPAAATYLLTQRPDAGRLATLAASSTEAQLHAALRVALLRRLDGVLVDVLLRRIDDVDHINATGELPPPTETVLFLALHSPQLLDALIVRGADVNFRNGFGKTPLYYAIESGDASIVAQLIDHGADAGNRYVSASDAEADPCTYTISHTGRTPLMHAAQHGDVEIIRLLAGHGADINAVDDKGFSVLDYASMNDRGDNARFLQARGARVGCIEGHFSSAACIRRAPSGETPAANPVPR